MTSNVPTSPADTRPSDQHFHHAPEQTELAKYLNRLLTSIEPYANQILLGCIAVTVVAVGFIWWSRSEGAGRTVGWQRFASSRAPDDFAALADQYGDSNVGVWARLEAGRGYLEEGLNLAMTNRSASDERLNLAKGAFEKLLLLQKRIAPEIREEALYGMATTLETLSDGNMEPAVQAYQQLVQEFPESRHAPWATSRIEALQSSGAQEFYAWFRQQNPKPSDRPTPRDVHSLFDPDQLRLDMPLGAETPSASAGVEAELDADVPPSPKLPQRLDESTGPAPRAFPPQDGSQPESSEQPTESNES